MSKKKLHISTLEGGTTMFWNTKSRLPSDATSYFRRMATSATPLWGPKTSRF